MANWLKIFTPLLAGLLFSATALAAPPPAGPPAPIALEKMVNLGVPVGNVPLPKFVALNSPERLLYIFSEGEAQQGNLLSVFNLKTKEFTHRLQLNQSDAQPLGLQFDPASGLLYALWQERSANARPVLAVIDSKVLQLSQQIPNIEAFAANNGILYAATATELLAVNLSNNSLEQARRVSLPPVAAPAGPLAVDAAHHRLYLGRKTEAGWAIEIFETESLQLQTHYATDGQVLDILPQSATDQAFFTTDQTGVRVLGRITGSGELADLPVELGPHYGAEGIALAADGNTLFYSNGQWGSDPGQGPALVGLDAKTLAETRRIPLLSNVDHLIVDDQTGHAYAVYPYAHHLYQIDLSAATFEIEVTAVRLRDVQLDAAGNRLFVSDSANRIRQLDPATLAPQKETLLHNNWADFGFKNQDWSGQLALDTNRKRLYVSGLPAVALDTSTLAETATLDPGGQFALASGGSTVYLSNCGVTMLNAATLSPSGVISGSTARPDGLSPNPCVGHSYLDAQNQWLYSIVPNGVPGSNGGSQLYVYNVAPLSPTLIFSDTNISFLSAEPDPAGQRAFVSYLRNSNQRLLTLSPASQKYSHHLLGLWGQARYSPASNRLYVADGNSARLLTLDADTLDVLAELRLPGDNFRLVEIDPATDRLYLIDSAGNLLTTAPGATPAAAISPPPAPAVHADDAVLGLAAPANGPVIARINSHVREFSLEAYLYRTTDGGQNWANLGQNLPPYPVQAVAASPNFATDQTLLASVLNSGISGGLYKSVDGGQSWQPAMTGLRDLWVNALTFAPDFNRTGLVFAQTFYGGLHFSVDGGDTWQPVAELNPNDPFPVFSSDFAAAISAKSILISQPLNQMHGLFRATRRANGGPSTWEQVLDQTASRLALSPDGQTALAYGNALWRSTNSGRNWEIGGAGLTQESAVRPDQMFFSPQFNRDHTVYFFCADTSGSAQSILYRSTDGGQNWLPWQLPADSPIFTAFTLTPTGDFLLGDTAGRLTQQSPAAMRWATANLPASRFTLDDLAADSSGATLFAVSGPHGLFKSTNGGRGWQRTNYPVRRLDFSSRRFQVAVAGPTVFVASGVSLHRSDTGGDSWQALSLGGAGFTFPAQQIALSPNYATDKTLLVGTPTALYRSADGGESWQQVLSIAAESSTPDVLTFAPNGQTAYVRFGYGQNLYRSADAGQSWQIQPNTAGDEFFSILAYDADAGGTLSAAVEFDRKLAQTDSQTPPWRNLTGLLPAELGSVDGVVYQNGNLVVAGMGGLFRSADNGQSWQPISGSGLPADVVLTGLYRIGPNLAVTFSDGAIYAATGDSGATWKDISIVK